MFRIETRTMAKRMFFRRWMILGLFLFTGSSLFAQSWNSEIVYRNGAGQMVYVSDSLGNHVPNWAHAGYHNGDAPLPYLNNVDTIAPVSGDNLAHLQAAIDAVGALPLDANGHRGALLLSAGSYPFAGTLRLDKSGVVLRGVGDGSDPATNTILLSTDTNAIDILIAGNGTNWKRWRDSVPGTKQNILNECLTIGSHWIELSDASGYAPGLPVVIHHPSTAAWLASVNYGDPDTNLPWMPNEIDLVCRRKVAAVNGNFIQLDAPLQHPLKRELSQAYVYVHDSTTLEREIGIENLRVDCNYTSPTDENHAWNAIALYEAENSWVRDVTVTHYARGGIVTATASNITVQDCRSVDPISIITGSRRYNFDAEGGSANILFRGCYATEGRHAFVSNGASTASGIVFTASTSIGDWTSSEGHRKWSFALLFDSLDVLQPNTTSSNPVFDRVLGLYNRGYYGSSHGWGSAHSALWNCRGEDAYFVVEQPPSAQNYGIGCSISNGSVLGSGPFGHSSGWIEGSGQIPEIGSLYQAQMQQKLLYGNLPDPAACLLASDTSAGIYLSWYDNDKAESGYTVERSPDGQNFQVITTLPANSTSYCDSLTQSGTFYYRVQSFNVSAIAPYSNWVRDSFDYVVGREPLVSRAPQVFPAPADDSFYIAFADDAQAFGSTILIQNLSGQLVLLASPQSVRHQIETSHFASGIYLLRIASGDQFWTFKLQVRH